MQSSKQAKKHTRALKAAQKVKSGSQKQPKEAQKGPESSQEKQKKQKWSEKRPKNSKRQSRIQRGRKNRQGELQKCNLNYPREKCRMGDNTTMNWQKRMGDPKTIPKAGLPQVMAGPQA